MLAKIHLNNIKTQAIIGCLPREQSEPQELVIDLTLEVDAKTSSKSDNIEDAVDYSRVLQSVLDFVSSSSFKLLEALSKALGDYLLKQFEIKSARLVIQKPKAFKDLAQVSIETFHSTCEK